MFEILKALRALNEACTAHGTRLAWDIDAEGQTLTAEIPVTADDMQFVRDMQAMFAVSED